MAGGDGQPAGQRMGVAIAGEHHDLKEHHGHRPHGGRAAEQRQRHFREHRLDGEQQERGLRKIVKANSGRTALPRAEVGAQSPRAPLLAPGDSVESRDRALAAAGAGDHVAARPLGRKSEDGGADRGGETRSAKASVPLRGGASARRSAIGRQAKPIARRRCDARRARRHGARVSAWAYDSRPASGLKDTMATDHTEGEPPSRRPFREHRLDGEQPQRGQEDRQREERQDGAASGREVGAPPRRLERRRIAASPVRRGGPRGLAALRIPRYATSRLGPLRRYPLAAPPPPPPPPLGPHAPG